MKKFYIIWQYHDTFVAEFNSNLDMIDYLEHLKEEYKNDNDFKYKVIFGEEMKEEGEE